MKEINTADIEKFHNKLQEADKITIVSHMKPDGDAAGSTLAMYHFLKEYSNTEPKIVLNDPLQHVLEFLVDSQTKQDIIVYSDDPLAAEEAISDSSMVIGLDFNAFHRTDRLCCHLEESKAYKVLIDHHLNPDLSQFEIVFSETKISSASELLYHILMEMPEIQNDASRLPSGTTAALMTGMTTDTNNFANSVYPSTLMMASSLLEAGVDRDYILSQLYNQHSENRLRLMGHMMKDLLVITEDGAAYIILDQQTQCKYKIQDGDTEGFVNMPLSIANVRLSMLLKEDGEKIRVSIRSKKGTSANRCAQKYFNGGGHENAAGGRLNMPVAEVEEYIKKYVHIYLTEDEA